MRLARCVRCGRGVAISGREHCARCHYVIHRPQKRPCPGCGKEQGPRSGHWPVRAVLTDLRPLREQGRPPRPPAVQPVPGPGPAGRRLAALPPVRETGPDPREHRLVRPLFAPRPATDPRCGLQRLRPGHPAGGAGLCPRCYESSPHRITVRAGNIAAGLDDPPAWLPGFAGYLTSRHHPTRACQMLTSLGKLLQDGNPGHPQAVLERASQHGVPFTRALEDFLTRHGLALPADHEERTAAGRRRHRLDAIPAALRPAATAFADHELPAGNEPGGPEPAPASTPRSNLT